MTALCIIGGILLLLGLLLAIPLELHLIFDHFLILTLRIGFFSVHLVPKKEKPMRLRDFSPRRLHRLLRREEEKAIRSEARKTEKAARRAARKQDKSADGHGNKRSFAEIWDMISAITEILHSVVGRLGQHLSARILRLSVRIGCEEAAKTALLCAGVNNAAVALVECLRCGTRFDERSLDNIFIEPDFLHPESSASVDLQLRTHLFGVLGILFHALFAFLQRKSRILPDHPEKPKISEKIKEQING